LGAGGGTPPPAVVWWQKKKIFQQKREGVTDVEHGAEEGEVQKRKKDTKTRRKTSNGREVSKAGTRCEVNRESRRGEKRQKISRVKKKYKNG